VKGTATESGAPNQARPEVILDFELDRGFLFMLLKNIGQQPAVKVVAKISPEIIGPDGKTPVNGINLFRHLEFFAPGREFRVLISYAQTYFSSKQPTSITADISYRDQSNKGYAVSITHNLLIFKDLPQPVEGE